MMTLTTTIQLTSLSTVAASHTTNVAAAAVWHFHRRRWRCWRHSQFMSASERSTRRRCLQRLSVHVYTSHTHTRIRLRNDRYCVGSDVKLSLARMRDNYEITTSNHKLAAWLLTYPNPGCFFVGKERVLWSLELANSLSVEQFIRACYRLGLASIFALGISVRKPFQQSAFEGNDYYSIFIAYWKYHFTCRPFGVPMSLLKKHPVFSFTHQKKT